MPFIPEVFTQPTVSLQGELLPKDAARPSSWHQSSRERLFSRFFLLTITRVFPNGKIHRIPHREETDEGTPTTQARKGRNMTLERPCRVGNNAEKVQNKQRRNMSSFASTKSTRS